MFSVPFFCVCVIPVLSDTPTVFERGSSDWEKSEQSDEPSDGELKTTQPGKAPPPRSVFKL